MAERVRLSRAKGWKMPPNTVKVDRTTRWGNPFRVGVHGTAKECVKWFGLALAGYHVLGYRDELGQHIDTRKLAKLVHRDQRFLAGKNLACWCAPDKPCHADILLHVAANYEREQRGEKRLPLDLSPYTDALPSTEGITK